jgi:hypothetical protein
MLAWATNKDGSESAALGPVVVHVITVPTTRPMEKWEVRVAATARGSFGPGEHYVLAGTTHGPRDQAKKQAEDALRAWAGPLRVLFSATQTGGTQ